MSAWDSFIAIGDSFTEGLDDWRPDGTPRGWADRVAERLAVDRPGFRYANLAVRGKLLDQIVADQIPVAERLRPDLIAFSAGGNDIIRFSCDTDELARRFDAALGRVTATGAAGGRVHRLRPGPDAPVDPAPARPGGLLQRADAGQRGAARQHGGRPLGDDPADRSALLGSDRLHLTTEGHRRVALRVLETLGEPVADDWRAPLPAADPTPWRARQLEDLRWMRECVMPFVRGRLQGRRTGDGFYPKRPELLPVDGGGQPAI